MSRWIEILIPMVLTGIALLGTNIHNRVTDLEASRNINNKYIDQFQNMQDQDREYGARIRKLEDTLQVHLVEVKKGCCTVKTR